MKIAQQHLASQHTQLDNLSASIATQVMSYSEASQNFIAQQQTDLSNAQIASSALRDELCVLFQSYHDEHVKELEEVKASIGQQVRNTLATNLPIYPISIPSQYTINIPTRYPINTPNRHTLLNHT